MDFGMVNFVTKPDEGFAIRNINILFPIHTTLRKVSRL